MFIALILNLLVHLNMQFNISAELPPHIEEHHPRLNSFDVACLMAIFPVTNIVTAPLVGILLQRVGRRNVVWIGICMMTLSTLSFGVASYLANDWAFFCVSLVARSMQGLADSCVCVSTLSIIVQEFPNDKAKYIGYWQLSIGLGLASGPVLGSFAFGLMSYVNTFYFLAAYVFCIGAFCMSLIPERIN